MREHEIQSFSRSFRGDPDRIRIFDLLSGVPSASELGEADSTTLHEHCRSRLAGYKCPVKFFWLSSLPRTANGKLLRRELASRSNEARNQMGHGPKKSSVAARTAT